MNSFSIWHWLIVLIVLSVCFLIPGGKIIRRTGHSPWWVLLTLIPGAAIVGLWVLAVCRWPTVDQ
jgi:hypothetical protein